MKNLARLSLIGLFLSVGVLSACHIFPDPKDANGNENVEIVQSGQKDTQKDAQKDLVEIYFAKKSGEELELVAVRRPIRGDNQLKDTIEELLRGPTPEEEKEGLLSEIPKGTILLGIRDFEGDYEIDLSKRFSTGSISSMQTRLDQMTKTVSPLAGEKKIYLDVEGKRLDASSFDGLEIKQPIN